MKFLPFGVLIVLCVNYVKLQIVQDEWIKYKEIFKREFHDPMEEAKRKVAFIETHQFIMQLNKRFDNERSTFRVNHNEFSDLPRRDFIRRLGLRFPSERAYIDISNIDELRPFKTDLPKFFNYARGTNGVSGIKDQGDCGSSYAFAVVAALEAQYRLKYNKTIKFSEQQLVDCSRDLGNEGCTGGWFTETFEYITTHGITRNAKYPYTSEEKECSLNETMKSKSMKGYKFYGKVTESQLLQILMQFGPVAVGIDASDRSFQQYSSGVYFLKNCSKNLSGLNHAVLLTGYGSNNFDGDFWIIKNSWGKSWGKNGYGKIARNRRNACGIATAPFVPVIA